MSDVPPRKKFTPENLPLIVPARIDDFGLSAAEFRVLARIARRCGADEKGMVGICFESLDSMAKGCKLCRNTVTKAIDRLLYLDLITEEERPGRATILRLKLPNENEPF